MSQIDSILGLSDLTIQRVDLGQIIQVWASPKTRPRCIHCLNHPVRIKATHLRTLKHTRQGNQLVVLYLSVPKYHCLGCNRYFRHPFKGIRPRFRATEIMKCAQMDREMTVFPPCIQPLLSQRPDSRSS